MEWLKKKLNLTWDMAAGHDEEAKAKLKKYFDRKATACSFAVGEMIMTLEPSILDKFQPPWTGPYQIVEKVTDVTYCVATPDQRKKQKSLVWLAGVSVSCKKTHVIQRRDGISFLLSRMERRVLRSCPVSNNSGLSSYVESLKIF